MNRLLNILAFSTHIRDLCQIIPFASKQNICRANVFHAGQWSDEFGIDFKPIHYEGQSCAWALGLLTSMLGVVSIILL